MSLFFFLVACELFQWCRYKTKLQILSYFTNGVDDIIVAENVVQSLSLLSRVFSEWLVENVQRYFLRYIRGDSEQTGRPEIGEMFARMDLPKPLPVAENDNFQLEKRS